MTATDGPVTTPSNYAEDLVAEARARGREDALEVITRLRTEGECSCMECLRDELERLP